MNIEKDFKSIGEVLKKTVRKVKARRKENSSLRDRWAMVAGKEISEHTDVAGIRESMLHVRVDSAMWLHYVRTFKKEELLKSMQNIYKQKYIADIKFYISNLNNNK